MKFTSIFNRNRSKNKKIFYITADKTWCFHWEGEYLSNLLEKNNIILQICSNPWDLKNKIIHFGDRYLFFSKSDDEIINLCTKNSVILTWFHGGPEDGEQFDLMLKRLNKLQNYIQYIHTSCSITKNILIKSGINPQIIIAIPIAVDLSTFKHIDGGREIFRKNLSIPSEALVIGSFQKDGDGWGEGDNPKLIKGPDIFLEVIQKIYPDIPNLFVVLTGPSRGYVKSGLEMIGVPYVHHYLDNYLDIVKYYQTLDLYLITSRAEGGPKALAECWACGVPVISTKVGMCADYIRNSENGCIVDINDVEGLCHASQKMLISTFREKCISNGLLDVRFLSWERIGNMYLENLYLPLMSE